MKVGQEVLSQNAGNPAGALEEEAVTGVETHIVYVLRAVTVQAADGTSETIDTTDSHPFYVQGSGWVSAGDLQAGETLQTSDGQTVTVVRTYRIAEPQGVKVYNLTVAGDHTYFVEPAGVVGGEAVWVHNGCTVAEAEQIAALKDKSPSILADGAEGYMDDLGFPVRHSAHEGDGHLLVMRDSANEIIGHAGGTVEDTLMLYNKTLRDPRDPFTITDHGIKPDVQVFQKQSGGWQRIGSPIEVERAGNVAAFEKNVAKYGNSSAFDLRTY